MLTRIKCPKCGSNLVVVKIDGGEISAESCSSPTCDFFSCIDDSVEPTSQNDLQNDNISNDVMDVAECLDSLLEKHPCPRCCSFKTFQVPPLDDRSTEVLNIRCCRDCQLCFGADDSMDAEDLRVLLEENRLSIRTETICECGNNDVEKFVIIGFDETGDRQPEVECQVCRRIIQLEIEDEKLSRISSRNVSDDDEIDDEINSYKSLKKRNVIDDQEEVGFLCSECGNDVDDVFEKEYDKDDGHLTSAKCLNCDGVAILTLGQRVTSQKQSVWNRTCSVCGNSNEDDFTKTSDVGSKFVACLICRNFLESPKKSNPESPAGDYKRMSSEPVAERRKSEICCNGTKEPIRRRVQSSVELKVGDHLAWQKDYIIWHHAILVEIKPCEKKLKVVHYTGDIRRKSGHFVSVRQEEVETSPEKDKLYVYDYGPESRSAPEVISRARSRIGEHRYNPLSNNCEHFARWCKTGMEYSNQAKSFGSRLLRSLSSAVGRSIAEDAITGAANGLIGGGVRAAGGGGMKAAAPALLKEVKGGAVVFGVFLNLAVEAATFVQCTCRAHRRHKLGEISKDEFCRQVCQVGCECAGGLLGATGGGFLGQLAIPVPVLGSFIGCTLGSLIGRFLGSMVGKKLGEIIWRKA